MTLHVIVGTGMVWLLTYGIDEVSLEGIDDGSLDELGTTDGIDDGSLDGTDDSSLDELGCLQALPGDLWAKQNIFLIMVRLSW